MRGEMVKMMVVSDGGKTVHMDTPSVLGLDERCIEYLLESIKYTEAMGGDRMHLLPCF